MLCVAPNLGPNVPATSGDQSVLLGTPGPGKTNKFRRSNTLREKRAPRPPSFKTGALEHSDACFQAWWRGLKSCARRTKFEPGAYRTFKVSDMEDLFRVPDGRRCATNQVRYNLDSRGIEYELLPWCEQHSIPVMAYSPLGGNSLVDDPTLAQIGAAHGCSAVTVALAWAIRSGNVIAIPEAAHQSIRENAVALSLTLTPHEIETLNAAHPMKAVDFLRFVLDRGRRWLPKF
jgi:diketogulonate reductase-like aldo/keto reductase